MAASVTTNVLGVNLLEAYDAILTATPEIPAHPHVYGTRLQDNNGGEWVFAKVNTGATINQNNAVTIGRTFDDAIPCARGSGLTVRTRRFGVYQGATQLTAGMAAWFMLSGAPQVLIAGQAVLPGAVLYTSDTSGVLVSFALGTTVTASQFPVYGITPTATASGSTASAIAANMFFPTIGNFNERQGP